MRCFGDGVPLYERYHDEEWGRPIVDERALFERLSLEAFQSGLSWLTVLRKRDNFRRAFHGFDPARVARMGETDIERLLADEGIIRNRAKIEATVSNAAVLTELNASGWSLSEAFWNYSLTSDAPVTFAGMAPYSDDAKTLSKDLKKRGFRFLGPTTVYSAMQAIGVVNDHLAACPVRGEVERQRRSELGVRR
jgi:DNA-3-methyladenine glycosylase I